MAGGSDLEGSPDVGPRPALAALAIALVFACVLASFAASLRGELVYDDRLLIEGNPALTEPGRLGELLTRPQWEFAAGGGPGVGYWRPLSSLALASAFRIGGASEAVLHAASLAFHLLSCAAVFLIARELTRSLPAAATAGLLFGLHPVHVESVAWISAQNVPLSGSLALLATWLHLLWRRRGAVGLPYSSGLCFVLALLAKEQAVALPLLFLTVDLCTPGSRQEGAARRAYALYGCVLAVYVIARVAVFQSIWAGFDLPTTDFRVGMGRLLLLRAEILGGALAILGWPSDLRLFRPFRPDLSLASGDAGVWVALAACLALAGAIAWTVRSRRHRTLLGLLVVPAALAPVLVAVQSVGRFPLSNRFLYVASLGPALLAAVLLARRPRLLLPPLLIAAGLLGWLSRERVASWKDEMALFTTAAAETPRSPYVLWGLGRVLLERYQESEDPRYLDEAFTVYEKGQELLEESRRAQGDLFVTSKDFFEIHLGLGWCYLLDDLREGFSSFGTALAVWEELAGEVEEALGERQLARELGRPSDPTPLDLDRVYVALGVGYRHAGRHEEARAVLKKALSYRPDSPDALEQMGRLASDRGEWKEAVRFFERALETNPGSYERKLLLAQALYSIGGLGRAEILARELVERPPCHPQPRVILAAVKLSEGDPAAGITWLDRAIACDPSYGHAWYLKGKAYVSLEKREDAVVCFQKAVELQPASFEAQRDFGIFLLSSGAGASALPHLVRAYGLTMDPAAAASLREAFALLSFENPADLAALALADQRRGVLDTAERWIDAALELDPERAETTRIKARILRELGRLEEAARWLGRTAELAPTFLSVSEHGLLLAELGRSSQAADVLERSLELPFPAGWTPEHVDSARESIRSRIAELAEAGPPPESP